MKNKIVLITGASSGIGQSCAKEFARHGANIILVARRKDRIEQLSKDLNQQYDVKTLTLTIDVSNKEQVEKTLGELPTDWRNIDVLINNAGVGLGLEKLYEGKLDDWDRMIDTNVKGLLYVSRQIIPGMVQRNQGHVINIGSIAGHEAYANGAVYCATKSAVKAISQSLKKDLLGTRVRVTEIDPGKVETEFSVVRFHGDVERAKQEYKGFAPLTPQDIAETVYFAASRPAHVNISEMIVLATAQSSATVVHRDDNA